MQLSKWIRLPASDHKSHPSGWFNSEENILVVYCHVLSPASLTLKASHGMVYAHPGFA